ncbi:hypothetical protein [Sphingobacterium bovistauri]|uniref:Uncharacterized protein n=1 Tax=Sphingobacterium bovistauri TaxID=2781959 RepID=A0ABS7ZD72_9SPHI|nr:hypothetical protein [Sphingobacterium bovistauri]MCA5006835.1 hypothetical protein [Sphingobacterium bovistauri]
MRLIAYFVCIIFTFVSLGGTIYIHQCKDATLLSLYKQIDTKSCPLCEKHHNDDHQKTENCDGGCKDSTLKIDPLSDENFNINQAFFVQLSPAIIPIFWISNFGAPTKDTLQKKSLDFLFTFSDSSPPIYLQNCIFRI